MTTANSFLFTTQSSSDRKKKIAVLIHPPGANFEDVFLPKLKQLLCEESTELFVIIGHVNPNRVAMLKSLSAIYSEIE